MTRIQNRSVPGSFAVTAHGWAGHPATTQASELGLGAAVRGTATPKPLDSLYQVKVVQVAAGFSHTACVTDSGLLYLWGYGAYGQLGFGFDDLRSSMRLGRGWSATKPGQGQECCAQIECQDESEV
ncbi:unnamed protein product [Effrenium voratum]|nr:unnamed protein product [Effrenium voratum]